MTEPRGRLTYRAVWQVDDEHFQSAARTVAQCLGPPMVSAAIDTALHRLIAEAIGPERPRIGAVNVIARTLDSAPLDPDGPFATPDGQALLAGFLTDLLAWDAQTDPADLDAWPPLSDELRQRARGLLAGLTVEVRHLDPLPKE